MEVGSGKIVEKGWSWRKSKKGEKGGKGKKIGEKLADWWSSGGPFGDGALC